MRKNRRKYKPSAMLVPGQVRVITRKLSYRRIIDVSKTWYVVKTAGGASERRAELGLRSSGFDTFRPHEDRWRIYRRRCSDVSVGWFRGYIFVGCGGVPRFDLVRCTDGVASILGVSGAPLSVPGELLQKVADELAGIKKNAPAPFSEGSRVSVRRGPFAELVGIVRELDHEGERAMVKIDMLGKEHELELGYADLKVA
jgi:transcription termination/antitermination protein NusG